jgi:hypothetical protein
MEYHDTLDTASHDRLVDILRTRAFLTMFPRGETRPLGILRAVRHRPAA